MSSSEEDLEKFQECVIKLPKVNDSKLEKPRSNRTMKDDLRTYDYKSLRVTQTFQKHVSKHLDELLDKTKFVKMKGRKRKKAKEKGGFGINLLSNSVLLTDLAEENLKLKLKPSKRYSNQLNDEETLKRAAEVAVSGEYILSKREVKSWAPETRGKIEII